MTADLIHIRVVGCIDPVEAERYATTAIEQWVTSFQIIGGPARTGQRRMVFRCLIPRGELDEQLDATIEGVEIHAYRCERKEKRR